MKKTLSIRNEMLVEGLEAEKERIQQEKLRKRYVYEAICALADTVDESELQRHLSILDPSAWCEVVEERSLGRLCGFPLCDKAISVDFRKKHTILRRRNELTGKERKMIVPTESETVKFCSDRCMGKSRAIAAQLEDQRKQFIIPKDKSQWKTFLAGDDAGGPSNEREMDDQNSSTTTVQKPKFGVGLVTKLHDLKLADAESNEEEDADATAEGLSDDSESEEKRFIQQIKSFVTTKELKNCPQTGPKEWKRGFLLVSPSPTDEQRTDSPESSAEDKGRNGQVSKRTPLVGGVIERMAPINEKKRSKGAVKDANSQKPIVIEAPRIGAEQVRLTF